jgi:hypothetical protein
MKGVFAPPGSYIPGTAVTLKVGEIRGVESAGMLLSYREMGLGEDHSGIVELDESAPVGMAYAEWAGLDDPVIALLARISSCLRASSRVLTGLVCQIVKVDVSDPGEGSQFNLSASKRAAAES